MIRYGWERVKMFAAQVEMLAGFLSRGWPLEKYFPLLDYSVLSISPLTYHNFVKEMQNYHNYW